jgi:predicted TIM-barrel enzyme
MRGFSTRSANSLLKGLSEGTPHISNPVGSGRVRVLRRDLTAAPEVVSHSRNSLHRVQCLFQNALGPAGVVDAAGAEVCHI